jgi:hypothetical protein
MVSRLYHVDQAKKIMFLVEGLYKELVAATARVYDSQGNPISPELKPAISGNRIEVELPLEIANSVGDYVVNFKVATEVNKPPLEFPMYFAVTSSEMFKQAENLPVAKLTTKSNRNDVEEAMSKTIKELRRKLSNVGAAQVAMNAARISTDKDWLPEKAVKNIVSRPTGVKLVING